MKNETLFIADLRSNNNGGKSTGHFLPVAAMYQQLFFGQCEVKVAGGPVYLTRFREDEMCLLPYDVSTTDIKGKWHTMKNAVRLFRAAKGQPIVLQQATVVTAMIAIALLYRKTSRLFLILYSDEGVRTWFRRLIYRFAKRKIDGVICPNDDVGRAYGIPYCVVPDYIYTDGNDRTTQKSYKEKIYDFCMIGRISPEKGIIEAARKLCNTHYNVLIAGRPQNAELEKELHAICDGAFNMDLRLEYVSDEDYINYLNGSRYAILNYSGEYSERSSGVVFDTLFNGVPVIGRRCKALNFIEEQGLGLLYDNISEFEPNVVLNEKFYTNSLKEIEEYRGTHREFVEKLMKFVCR